MTNSAEMQAIEALYRALLEAWNRQDAHNFAALFTEDANVVGFDGSPMDGRTAIEQEISRIFRDHKTATYVWIVREIRLLSPETTLLRGVVGMIPPGKSDLNPATNAIQSLIAVKQGDGWKIALFQNTPAQFHGRKEVAEALTEELRKLVPG